MILDNVEDMADEKQQATSDLKIATQRFNAMAYGVQVASGNSSVYATPQNRYRLILIAMNEKDPKTIEFSTRSISDVFASFSASLKVCERKPECASKFLLADDDPHVLRELDRAQKETSERTVAGYAQSPCRSPNRRA